MTRILGISGSLRAASFNTALLHAAASRMPAGAAFEVATLHGIPLYDGDLEAQEGLPPAVIALREKIAAADGLLLATPEYNSGVPGVFKNALDWLSRTSDAYPPVLAGKAVALTGASPGRFGTVSAQAHWLPVLHALGMRHWSGARLMVAKADGVLAGNALQDAAVDAQLTKFVAGFVAFVRQGAV